VRASLVSALFLVAASARAEAPAVAMSAVPSGQAPLAVPAPSGSSLDAPAPSAARPAEPSAAPEPPLLAPSAEPTEPAELVPETSVAAIPSGLAAASASALALASAPVPAATPAASSSAPVATAAVPVRLEDAPVFVIRGPRGAESAVDRARRSERKLGEAAQDPQVRDVRVVREGESAVVYAGPTPIVQLEAEDARLAGDVTLGVHAAEVAAQVRKALEAARKRNALKNDVYSVSLVVFFALIALFLVKKLGEFADRARLWLDGHGNRVAIRVQSIELVRPATVKSAALIALGLAKLIGQFGILYAWLVFLLSRFESTRGYTDQVTGFLVHPFSDLVSRVVAAFPLLVFGLIAGLIVFVLVRFVGLFLASVARREATLAWVPPEFAGAISVLIRMGIVILALLFAAPIVTGGADGAFARAGLIALIALGLASIPLFASGLVGAIMIFGRRLRVGEHVEIAGRTGRIDAIDLFDFRVDSAGLELRIPHLVLLRTPILRLGLEPRVSVELVVSSGVTPSAVVRVLEEAASSVGRDARVELDSADVDGARYRLSVTCDSLATRAELARRALEALAAAAIPLGRSSLPARLP
jgi:small-conductance mechanosensitive channel